MSKSVTLPEYKQAKPTQVLKTNINKSSKKELWKRYCNTQTVNKTESIPYSWLEQDIDSSKINLYLVN